MWIYEQTSGKLFRDCIVVGVGYSGFGEDKNQPNDESVKDLGPIPHGKYSIGPPECVGAPGPHGPFVLRLTPDPSNAMFGRDGFLIHGDSREHQGSASHGCIIMNRDVRNLIAASGDSELSVKP